MSPGVADATEQIIHARVGLARGNQRGEKPPDTHGNCK
jgi:hypothetical protein